jgi:hypothetical protein
MRVSLCRLTLATLALIASVVPCAFAQSGTTRTALSGTVLDTSGGVLPGATVDVKNTRTGVVTSTVTSSTGVFDVPAIDAGVYTITVTLSGFKTAVLTDVELLSATPRSVNVALEIGAMNQAVEVRGGSQLVQTQTTMVSSTIRVDQISTLPLITRNALNFVVFLPGVDTSSGNHSQRSSTVSGLPQSALSLTIDGANIQDKYTRSGDGFFANIHPKLDLIEEVTVSTATATADSSGQGAVQIKFATRSGTNTFVGSAYEYFRHADLNTNYYFNIRAGLPKNQLTLNQWGAREGGPILIPGLYDGRGKAFFFFNFEQLRFPLNNTRTRGILTTDAEQGVFRYPGGSQSVNLFAIAALTGQTATADPTIAALLAKIRAGAETTGIINTRTDLNTLEYLWQPSSLRIDNSPGGRIDYNVSTRHRASVSYNYQGQRLNPNLFGGDEPNFPGLVNRASLYSAVSRGSVMLRSTFGANLVNELRWGLSNAPVWFADEVDQSQFADQAGFSINFPGIGAGITNATTNAAPSSRNGKSWNLDNSVNWLRGSHSLQFGASFSRIAGWTQAQTLVASLTLGVDTTNDPANGAMFNTTHFPGAANADLNNARALYALLTGRVTQIASNARLDGLTGRYVYLGEGQTNEQQDEFGLYIQDSWRIRPNLTINGGLRWQVAFPFQANSSVYSMNTLEDACGVSGFGDGPGGRECNLFNPGVFGTGARTPVYSLYEAGNAGYNTEYRNFAPNIGVAWRPNAQGGWLRAILGEPEEATIRASYGVSYNSDGLSFYTGVYGGNPGNQINTNRTTASTQFPLVPAGESWPLLLRQPDRLGASPGIPASPEYPMAINFANGVNLFHPDFRTPFARSFSAGVQRKLSRLMAIEIRYVGTRLVDGTTTEEWNEVNWTTNGFFDEFKLAQQNLQANLASGVAARANSFAYFGPGTGTSPLPIYLAAFNAQPQSQAGNQALYTGTNWTNNARLNELAARNPNPQAAAETLFTTAGFRTAMATAGYPVNFFVLNPAVSGVSVRTNGDFTSYDSLQISLRRALSGGLSVDANYVFATRSGSRLETLREPRTRVRSTAGVPHALKMTVVYELPFGRGKRFGTDSGAWLNGAIGGWSLNLTGRVQSGSILNFGNVRVEGMSLGELRDAFKIRIDPETKIVYTLPQDIIDNTIKAFSTSATSATGYGALGPPSGRYLAPANGPDCIQILRGDCTHADVFVEGPIFTRFDLNAKKRFQVGATKSFDIGVDVMNLFDAINFNAVAQAGSGATINQVNSSYQDPNVTFDPGGRLMQLVFRFNF